MPRRNNTAVWNVSNPSVWPKAPLWMSFSTLSDLEICPRRWSLSVADYPEVWGKHGYSPKPQMAQLEGKVVHLALRKITHALSKHGCASLRE